MRARKCCGANFAYLCSVKKFAVICLALLSFCALRAQTPVGYPMYYEVHDGDTVFFDTRGAADSTRAATGARSTAWFTISTRCIRMRLWAAN